MNVDQYAAATTASLARLAVEQASEAVDLGRADMNNLNPHMNARRRYLAESLVRCVDELARRAVAGAPCSCVDVGAYDRGDVERCERHGQRAVEGERRV